MAEFGSLDAPAPLKFTCHIDCRMCFQIARTAISVRSHQLASKDAVVTKTLTSSRLFSSTPEMTTISRRETAKMSTSAAFVSCCRAYRILSYAEDIYNDEWVLSMQAKIDRAEFERCSFQVVYEANLEAARLGC